MNFPTKIIALSIFTLPMFLGCSNVAERIDCSKVCNRYQECFDSDYDVDKCVDECSNDDDVNEADQCEACIDGASCTESFACVSECAGIVP